MENIGQYVPGREKRTWSRLGQRLPREKRENDRIRRRQSKALTFEKGKKESLRRKDLVRGIKTEETPPPLSNREGGRERSREHRNVGGTECCKSRMETYARDKRGRSTPLCGLLWSPEKEKKAFGSGKKKVKRDGEKERAPPCSLQKIQELGHRKWVLVSPESNQAFPANK